MTKIERRRAIQDIQAKVRIMMREATAHAMNRIAHLEYTELVGIAQDHADDKQSWRAPKNFLCAFAQIMASPRGYGPMVGSKKDRAKINLYKEHM